MTIGFASLFHEVPVMAILRGFGTARTIEVSRLAWRAGVHTVEVPLQSVEDVGVLMALAELATSEGRVVGAGTIIDRRGVADAAAAGAQFTVSPGWDPDVARASLDAGMVHLPGVGTGTEVQAVRRFGLDWAKVFPATQLGHEWISAMRGPFPDMSFLASGGIDAGNAESFLDAGAAAVAIGSALADPLQLERVRAIVAARSLST